MELFYMAQLWNRLFEVAHEWIKLLDIAKFDAADGLYLNVSKICKWF